MSKRETFISLSTLVLECGIQLTKELRCKQLRIIAWVLIYLLWLHIDKPLCLSISQSVMCLVRLTEHNIGAITATLWL